MKANGKKIIALILAIVMVLGSTPVLLAGAAEKNVSYSITCPYIDVTGLMGCVVYDNPNSPDGKDVMPSSETALNFVRDCIPDIMRFAVTGDWQTFGDKIIPGLVEMFKPAFLGKNGEASDGSGIRFSYPPKNSIRSNSRLKFNYDWRTDPIACAAQLNDFINYVCEASGCDKVSLSAHSCGGIVVLAYLTIYGDSKINGVVMNSTAVYGETYTGELLTNQLVINSDSLTSFLAYIFRGETEYEELINEILAMLNKAGLLDIVEVLGDGIVENLSDRLVEEFLIPLFACWPSIWAMCPDEYIDEAMDSVFDKALAEDKEDYAKLIEKIENYNETVRKHREETLIKTKNDVRFGVFARYGYCSIPVTPSWRLMSDGVIDTKYASFGATVSNFDKTLTAKQIAASEDKYISPDKQIDASTCLFPEQTWFIKYMKHAMPVKYLNDLEKAILYAPEKVTVDTYEEYPRYLIMDVETMTVTPQLAAEEKPSAPEKYTNILIQLLSLLKRLFSFIAEKINGAKG